MDCGPSNGVKNLVQYSQRDQSLQNEAGRSQNISQAKFRSQQPDGRLNEQFREFGGNQFANDFMAQMAMPPAVQQQQQRQQYQRQQQQFQQQFQPQQQQQQQQWVNDFSNLNLQQGVHQGVQGAQAAPGVHQGAQHYGAPPQQHQPFALNTRSHLHTNYMPNASYLTEHQQLHKAELALHSQELAQEHRQEPVQLSHEQFEKQFQDLESEMQVEQQAHDAEQQAHDKEQFAQTARKIETTLANVRNSEMSDKIKQSNFMKLMGQISTRNVELNQEGTKLVNQTGQDIRDIDYHHTTHQDTPMQYETETTASEPLRRQDFVSQIPTAPAQVASTTTQRLADPLAHIPDGSLANITDPFQAARAISGDQVKANDWLEQYDPPSFTEDVLSKMRQQEYDAYRSDDHYD